MISTHDPNKKDKKEFRYTICLDNVLWQRHQLNLKRLSFLSEKWKKYELENNLIIELSTGQFITIKKGTLVELDTIPKIVRPKMKGEAKFDVSYLIHKYLYVYGKRLGFSRYQADVEFLKWRWEIGIGKPLTRIGSLLQFLFVRALSKSHWRK